VLLGVDAVRGGLGADPVAAVLNQLGMIALVLLLASLACTPLRILLGQAWPMRLRKPLGLLGFGYATLHVATYVVVDQDLELGAILVDVTQRKFTIVGALTWLALLPLALTSNKAAVRRLGGARWRRLHQLAYLAGALGVLHFALRVKKDLTEPLIYAGVLAALFAVRIASHLRRRRRAARAG